MELKILAPFYLVFLPDSSPEPPVSLTGTHLQCVCPLLLSPQWRASGWSGGRGRGAASPVTAARSRGRGAAVRPCTAGLSARVCTRRTESAPTRPAAVRSTNPYADGGRGVSAVRLILMTPRLWNELIYLKMLSSIWVGGSVWLHDPSSRQRSLAPCCRRG